jgi:hypothetical protein
MMEINNFEYFNYYQERFVVGEHRPNHGLPPPTPANGLPGSEPASHGQPCPVFSDETTLARLP